MSIETDIADAVVDVLIAADLPMEIAAQRVFAPELLLKEGAAVKVLVTPAGLDVEGAARNCAAEDHEVHVAVLKRFADKQPFELDPLLDLVQAIRDLFPRTRLLEDESAAWQRTTVDPLFSDRYLREYRQFVSVVKLVFRVYR